MFKIDTEANRISRIEKRKFSDLGFREREHLQEWIANQPDSLGEELLIIQKEFDGFDETRERLDLLALDKNGNLVIIENKLDDTGRDVMWQALKYASYCSTLNKSQIIEIYQSYLNRYCFGGDAKMKLCEFLEVSDLDEVVLNPRTDQRLVLIAANFRKEVTSSVLWLLSHNIQVQCFKVTPFSLNEVLFLNVEQIIPTPEAKELMIGMNAKEAEERVTKAESKQRHDARLAFWTQLSEYLALNKYKFSIPRNPTEKNYINVSSTLSSSPYLFIIGKDFARIELYLGKSKEENKMVFDKLYSMKEQIESSFGGDLVWSRMDGNKASKVYIATDCKCYSNEDYDKVNLWLAETFLNFERALSPQVFEMSKSTSFNFTKLE